MALLVWLPLTADTRNQGTSSVTATSRGDAVLNNDGRVSRCYAFGTTNTSNIELSSSITTSVVSGTTVAAWIYLNSISGTKVIFSNKSGGPVNFSFEVVNDKLACYHYNGSWQYSYSTGTLAANTWYHVAFCVQNNVCTFYINGVASGTGDATVSSSYSGNIPNDLIGSRWSYSNPFNGKISDFRLYDECLSVEKVKKIANYPNYGLAVWLPLTKDAHNQGNAGPLITSGCTFADGGKLGAKYLSGGVITIPAEISKKIFNKTGMTFAFWLYPIGTTENGRIMGQDSMGTGNNRMYSMYQCCSGVRSFHLSWQDNTATNSAVYLGGSWSNFFDENTWTHCCVTYNGSQAKIYKNGVLYTTANGVSNRTSFEYDFPIFGAAIRKLNDVRIYDRCLSEEEIKWLSKGLCLHYPLDDAFIESASNLSGAKLSNSCYNGATSKYSYGTNTDIYKTSGTFQGHECEKVYMGTAGQAAHPYVFFDYLCPITGSTRTLTFDYYPTKCTELVFYSYNTSGTTIWENKGVNFGTQNGITIIPVILNQWNHIRLTITNTGSANDGWGYCQIGNGNHTSTTTDYWLFDNIMIVNGDHPLPFTTGTRTARNTIVDGSGFGHDGQLWNYDSYGSITVSSDTPKYKSSIHINNDAKNASGNIASGTRYIFGPCSLTTPHTLTIAFWCKAMAGYGNTNGQGQFCTTASIAPAINAGADYNTTCMHHRDSMIDFCASDGTHDTVGISFTSSEWHHYAVVYDGQTCRIYKDGVQTASKAFSAAKDLKTMNAVIIGYSNAGGVYRSNNSYYSDFRVYATALSASDVLSLYNNTAALDSSNQPIGRIRL